MGAAMTTPASSSVSFSDYVAAVRRHWKLVVLLVVLGMAAGYVTAPKPKPAGPVSITGSTTYYRATALLSTGSTSADPTGLSLDGMAYLATSGPVAQATAVQLGGGLTGPEVSSQVQVTAKDQLGVLQVTAQGSTPSGAATLANTFSAQLIDALNAQLAQSATATIASDKAQLAVLSKVISQIQQQPSSGLVQSELSQVNSQYVQLYLSMTQLQVAGPAHTDLHVVSPAEPAAAAVLSRGGTVAKVSSATSSKKVRLGLGFLLGLLIALVVAIVWERIDPRVRNKRDAERAFGLAVLGEIRNPRGAASAGPGTLDGLAPTEAEAYRMLQAELQIAPGERGRHTSAGSGKAILVTSPARPETARTVAVNLAAAFAEAGCSTAVIGIPDDEPILRRLTDSTATVATVDLGHDPEDKGAVRVRRSLIDGLSVVEESDPSRADGRRSLQHAHLVEAGLAVSDVVLVCCPPVLASHEALTLSGTVDMVVLVCEAGKVRFGEAAASTATLQRVSAPLHGVVMVSKPPRLRREPKAVQSPPGTAARPGAHPPKSDTAAYDGVYRSDSVQSNGLSHADVDGVAAHEEPESDQADPVPASADE